MGQLRQGDILLVPVTAVEPPSDARRSGEVILAEGEITGHAHRLRGAEVLEWSVDGQRYVRVLGGEAGTLQHEDHDPVPAAVVAPDVTYRVVQQRVWSLESQWRKVVD